MERAFRFCGIGMRSRSFVGAYSYRRTGIHFAGICAKMGRFRLLKRVNRMSLATLERTHTIPQTGHEARLMIRRNEYPGPTSGLAPGYVQGNLAILPNSLASDFLRFCQLNPKPCPLLATSAPGDPRLPS